ncbi:MAG: hypothetical protein U0Y68_01930 [Blastocatellia bacterium]
MKLPTQPVQFVILIVLLLSLGLNRQTFSQRSLTTPTQILLARPLEKMPLCFIANEGQFDPQVVYYVQGRDRMLYFTSQGVTFALLNATLGKSELPSRWIVKLDWLDANPKPNVIGKDQTEAAFGYFADASGQGRRARTYQTLVYENLWPGIDLIYRGTGEQMRYELLVKPGANPAQIKLAYRGASAVKLTPTGQVEVRTPLASWLEAKPIAYQEQNGQRSEVATGYTLDKKSGALGFLFGTYDTHQPLVIAPEQP